MKTMNAKSLTVWLVALAVTAVLAGQKRVSEAVEGKDTRQTGVRAKVLPDPAALKVNEGRLIGFENPLPRMKMDKRRCGTYNNLELSLPGMLSTEDARLGLFLQKLRSTIFDTRRMLFIDGRRVVCCHNWIRDHVQQMKGWKHWEYRPADFLDFIIETQRADGQFFELVKQMDDYHWTYVEEDSYRLYPEDNLCCALISKRTWNISSSRARGSITA